MLTDAPSIYYALSSWMEEPVRVLKNTAAQFATMPGSAIEEVKDAIKVPFWEGKVLFTA